MRKRRRRLRGWLARRGVLPYGGRYRVVLNAYALTFSIDYARPETIGQWLGELIASGVLDPTQPGWFEYRVAILPVNFTDPR